MSVFGDTATEEFPHFHSQWQRQQDHFRHLHCSDLSSVVCLVGVGMREVDCFSQREAYSFPFCPKVYKYVITGNYVREGEMSCSLRALVEHVPYRVSNSSSWEVYRRLGSSMHQLLRCLEYLLQRYGPFRITPHMIGWTELGVVKAWHHSDLTANQPEHPKASQQEMVRDLFKVLEGSHLLDHIKEHRFSTLAQIRQHFQNVPRERWPPVVHKQALTPIDNVSLCQSEQDRPDCFHLSQASGCSRKNITFSYSNKDLKINENTMRREENNKRSSIAFLEGHQHNKDSKVLTMRKEFTFGNNHQDQTSSMKVIYPLRNTHKKYSFANNNTPSQTPFKVQKLSDYFSKLRPTDRLEPKRVEMCCIPMRRQKPQLLHYSTSTNPYSKFINKKATVDQSASSLDHNSLHDDCPNSEMRHHENTKDVGKENCSLGSEYHVDLFDCGPVRDEVKNDLDALFDSNCGYDAQELEDELKNILFL